MIETCPPRLLAALVLALPLGAQSIVPTPLLPASAPRGIDGLRLEYDQAGIAALAAHHRVVMAGFPLPGGETADLDLERIEVRRFGFRFYVDGVERPDLLQGLDLSVWKGSVIGVPGSDVRLAFSRHGVRGWLHTGTDLVHVMPRPAAGTGDWEHGDVLVASEAAVQQIGMRLDAHCAYDQLNPLPREARSWSPPASGGPSGSSLLGPGCSLRECRVSITSDFQLFLVFGNLAAETSYVTTLLAFVSDQYVAQANTVLTFPYVQFYTSAADPWTAQDSGGGCGDVLNELQNAWAGNVPNGGRLGHLLSGANLGCGVAWLSVLCDNSNNFSVSGNLNGNVNFPVVQQPNNWDFIVVAHELGHNFGAPHTHDYCPPLDQCPAQQYWGPCQTQQQCINTGTIMSYCHLCSGGTANIQPVFHATNAADMTTHAANCLPLATAIAGEQVAQVAPDAPLVLTAVGNQTPTGPVQVFYRYYGTAFHALDMTPQGNDTYTAVLPAAGCDAVIEYYYSLSSACGTTTDPIDAPTGLYETQVGVATTVLDDDFETDQGWTATNQGATAGQWQRGVPVNDSGWAYDPVTDFDGSGQCWLTQNSVGNTDVDGGAVRLFSPPLDMSGLAPTIEYAYYLRLTNSNGADHLLVEISENGAAGPWTVVADHTTDGGTSWRQHAITAADLATAGVVLTSDMRLRFTANDANPQSVVEAGVDAFRIASVGCEGSGQNFCRGDGTIVACPCGNSGASGHGCANSAFADGVLLTGSGELSVAGDTAVLHALNVTGSTCVFFQGTSSLTPTPIDDGLGCVGGSVIRLGTQPVVGNASSFPQAGDPSISVRGQLPAFGGVRMYQVFYRNAAAFCTPATSNRSNGLLFLWNP